MKAHFLVPALFLAACSGSNEPSRKTVTYEIIGKNGITYRVHGPTGLTKAQIKADVLNKFPEAGVPMPPPPYTSFRGYACTDDCSGHEAGYEWAEEQGISDPDECGGNSMSFEEGCRAYAEEQGY